MVKVLLITNIASHYRGPIWAELLNSNLFNIEILFGENNKLGIEEIDFSEPPFNRKKNRLYIVKNYWFKNRILYWQSGVLSKCLFGKYDKIIFLGEFNILTNWLGSMICKVKNIEVVFWSHGLYGKESPLKKLIRILFFRLADKHIVYERRAKQLMIEEGFREENLYVVFNSLDYKKHNFFRKKFKNIKPSDLELKFYNQELPLLIFIGRLTKFKKLDHLIRVLNEINKKERKFNLLIIGDGTERIYLENQGEKGLDDKWLVFSGACYEEEEIAKYLSAADLCVSPGNIGLTAIHSLSYGTPICTHGDLDNQMPEAEVIIEGYNGFFIERDDENDLELKIIDWFSRDIDRPKLRVQCYEIIDRYYNPEYQLSVFERLITEKKPEI